MKTRKPLKRSAPLKRKARVKPRRHYYVTHMGECPVCGRDKSYKERVYGRPPPKEHRYFQMSDTETYDHCVG